MRMSRTVCGLLAVAAGAAIGAMVLPAARARFGPHEDPDERRVDEASEDSFPASDPPSFSGAAIQPNRVPPA